MKKTAAGSNFKSKNQKKTNERNFFTEEEVEEIKDSLAKILESNNKIDMKTLKSSVGSLESRNPFLFSVINDISSSSSRDMNFDEFIEALSIKLTEKETRAGTDRIYDLYLEDRNIDALNIAALTKMAKKLNENITQEELQNILEQAAANKTEITREEFYNIMARRSY